jgi:hypothetical protein
VLTLLRSDQQLAALGGSGFVIVPNFSGDQRPNDSGAFIVIRCGVNDQPQFPILGPRHFDLWVHLPAKWTDYVQIDNIIDRCDEILGAVEGDHIIGADGWALDYVGFEGRGPDMKDQGYETICRRASYYALASKAS